MKKFATIAIAAIAMFGWASEARADLMVSISTDNGATYTTICSNASAPNGGCVAPDNTVNGIMFTGLGGAAFQVPGTSLELSSVTSFLNTTATTQNFWVQVVATDYTLPTGGVLMKSHIGDTVPLPSGANALSFTSCVSQTNNSVCSTSAPTLFPNIADTGSDSSDSQTIIPNLGAPFAIVENINFTLGGFTSLNYSASTTLTPVPEPATTALFGLGLLGVGRAVRRRLGKRA